MQWKWTHSVCVSGEISDDVTFIHKRFPVPPSKGAIIEVHVSYPLQSIREQGQNPTIGIYTTNNHANIREQCTHTRYGQLGNQNMHTEITLDESKVQPPKCLEEDLDTVHCTGKIKVQDFKPRNFSFSFGFYCDELNPVSSLRGLVYNLSIYMTNEINCIPLPGAIDAYCSEYFTHGLLPDFFGAEDARSIVMASAAVTGYTDLFTKLCYQHLKELVHFGTVPKCDPVTKQVTQACREMCHDFTTACSKITLPINAHFSGKILKETTEDYKIEVDFNSTSYGINCEYLPSLNGNIPCLYKPVTCKSSPLVKNSAVLNYSNNNNYYSVWDTIDYSCNEGYEIEGNSKITCKYTGEWSKLPKCLPATKSKSHTLVVVLPLLLFLLATLLVMVTVRYRIHLKAKRKVDMETEQVELDETLMEMKGADRPLLKLKRKLDFKRNRFLDAFVLYHFDSDDDFVLNHIIPELEESRKFRLCIHSRDFRVGCDIEDNIEEAIEDSNSAIIVMSQGFVDSIWCKEEFTHCYIENMKNPTFNLFIIMMQAADSLDNISPYMKTCFANKTYLQVNDPELFTKLATHLKTARQPEYDDVDNDSIIVEVISSDEDLYDNVDDDTNNSDEHLNILNDDN